jgi:hypothetical protein
MSNAVVLYVQVAMSFIACGLLAQRYVVPRLRAAAFTAAAIALVFPHCFRHVGLLYLSTAAVPPGVPAAFAAPTAYGDLATALLAVATVIALQKNEKLGRGLAWVFNVVGLGDLMLAVVNSMRYHLVDHALGVAYLLPTLIVPVMVLSHLLLFWILMRPSTPASAHA